MKCPNDTDVTLLMTMRDGIEIDYCPQCRGVWLDRGELDKLIERAERAFDGRWSEPGVGRSERPRNREERWQVLGGSGDDDVLRGHRTGRKKRKGFFGELFDLD